MSFILSRLARCFWILGIGLWSALPLCADEDRADPYAWTQGDPPSPSKNLRVKFVSPFDHFVFAEEKPLSPLELPPGSGLKFDSPHVTYAASNGAAPELLEEEADGTFKLKLLIIGIGKIRMAPPLKENKVEKFIRTGTLYQQVGKKVTTRFWMKGDEGIMLRFSW